MRKAAIFTVDSGIALLITITALTVSQTLHSNIAVQPYKNARLQQQADHIVETIVTMGMLENETLDSINFKVSEIKPQNTQYYGELKRHRYIFGNLTLIDEEDFGLDLPEERTVMTSRAKVLVGEYDTWIHFNLYLWRRQ